MRLVDFFIIPFLMDATVSCAWLLSNYYAQDIGATKFQVGLKDFAWGVTYMLACLAAGRMADRLPRRALLVAGIALQGVSAWAIQWCGTPATLIAIMPFNALGCALFWPVFMTLLHDKDDAETNRRIGWFNLGWTGGLSVGMAVSGTLASWNTRGGFQMIGAAAAVNLLYFYLRTGRRTEASWRVGELVNDTNPPTHRPTNPPLTTSDACVRHHSPLTKERRRAYLYLGWLANFALCFAGAASNNQFPVLARSLHIPDPVSSVLIALGIVGHGTCSFLMTRTTRWHYRLAPLLGAKALAMGTLTLLLLATSPLVFGVGLFTLGIARAVGYAVSIYYCLNSDLSKGFTTGVHETLIGAAFTFGPLVAGGLAQAFTPRAPFAFAFFSTLTAMLIAVAMWRRANGVME